MKIEIRNEGAQTTLVASGRLDATWAGHLQQAVTDLIRSGQHQIQLDAAGIDYLSSAGIRSLLRMQRDLTAVQGSFAIVRPSAFVAESLQMTGLQALLGVSGAARCAANEPVATEGSAAAQHGAGPQHGALMEGMCVEGFELGAGEGMVAELSANWQPWQAVADAAIRSIAFPAGVYAVGIGAAAATPGQARDRMGEFLAADGYAAWLATDGSDRPDYMETSGAFVPTLQAIQALAAKGSPTLLLRFQPRQRGNSLTLNELIAGGFQRLQSDAICLIGLMEIEGLVGAALQRSPGQIGEGDSPGTFPDVRDWISYCGERLHRQQQALVVAFATRSKRHPLARFLPASGKDELNVHAHALVLPYRALPQGQIDCHEIVTTTLAELEPLNLLHLLQDNRANIGLGESAFIRGACWFGAITRFEETQA